MDIYAQLKKDHRKVQALFEEIMEYRDSTAKNVKTEVFALFEQLKLELDAHSKAEEKVLYARIINEDATREITLEAEQEHRLVTQLLEELNASKNTDERWFAKFAVLKEQVEHHVKEEEKDMFRKARKVLDKEEEEKLGHLMLAQKERMIASLQ